VSSGRRSSAGTQRSGIQVAHFASSDRVQGRCRLGRADQVGVVMIAWPDRCAGSCLWSSCECDPGRVREADQVEHFGDALAALFRDMRARRPWKSSRTRRSASRGSESFREGSDASSRIRIAVGSRRCAPRACGAHQPSRILTVVVFAGAVRAEKPKTSPAERQVEVVQRESCGRRPCGGGWSQSPARRPRHHRGGRRVLSGGCLRHFRSFA